MKESKSEIIKRGAEKFRTSALIGDSHKCADLAANPPYDPGDDDIKLREIVYEMGIIALAKEFRAIGISRLAETMEGK